MNNIYIPNTVTLIADDAFAGCTDITIKGYTGSEADMFAARNNLNFVSIGILEYSIHFDGNGSTAGSMETLDFCESGVEYKLPANAYARTGYKFTGWNTESDGSGMDFADEAVVKNLTTGKDITLYAQWTEKYKVGNPVYSVPSGTELIKGSLVSISTDTDGASIYYTVDGAAPTIAEENLYRAPIEITSPVTIKAIAIKDGYEDSEIVTAAYTIKDEAAKWGDIKTEDQTLYTDADEIPDALWLAGVSDRDYSGKAVTFPDLRVYYHKRLLVNNKDYVVKYASNTKAGTATIKITGKGNYSGTVVKPFEINKLNLGDGETNNPNLKILDITLADTKKMQKGKTEVYYTINGCAVALKSGRDFTYQYSSKYDYKTPGTHIVTIVGKGNYSGTATFTQTIDASKKLISKMKISKVANMAADGSALTPEVVIKDGAYTLEKDTDYELEWQNNVLPGTGMVIITGKGDYAGTKTVKFKITAIAIGKATVSGIVAQDYTGTNTSQSGYVLKYKANKNAAEETLTEGVDYTVSYLNEINAGKKAAVVFTGINRFSGTLKKTYAINPYVLSDAEVSPSDIGTVAYQKNGATPEITVTVGGKALKNGIDYSLKYSNNKAKNDGTGSKSPTVTIKGKGNYKGTITRTFKIDGSTLANTKMTATDIAYAKKAGVCKPKITLYDTNGIKLAAGKDYDKKTITYTYAKDVVVKHIDKKKNETTEEKSENTVVDRKNDIIPVGAEIRVTVFGKGNYAGTEQSAVFRFVKSDISKSTVKVNTQMFTGKEITPLKDELSITVGRGRNAVKLADTDYEIISYAANVNKGKASITIHGLGDYGGTKTVNFTINPRSID